MPVNNQRKEKTKGSSVDTENPFTKSHAHDKSPPPKKVWGIFLPCTNI